MLIIKKYYILVLAVLLILASVTIIRCTNFYFTKIEREKISQAGLSAEESTSIEGKIVFINENNRKEYAYKIDDKSTVFELMKKISAKKQINFEYQESNAGVFVSGINDIKNNVADNTFWMLYVNNALSPVGASDYKLSAGDVVEWKYLDTSKLDFNE